MEYQILPNSEVWANGVVCIPKSVLKKIKFLDSLKLAVLALALATDGEIDSKKIASSLRENELEVAEALEFWVLNGVLTDFQTVSSASSNNENAQSSKQSFERLPMPTLTPRDIVAMSLENDEIKILLTSAQEILGSTISASMQSNLVNMVTYYGLTVPVVLTLLQYYKTERENGKNITTHKLQLMAKEWAEQEIDNLQKASEKLQELEDIEELWGFVIDKCEFEYKKPTSSQEKMLRRWRADFSRDMISFAINTMRKYNEKDKQSIKEVDNILKDWKRKGCSTPDEVKAYKKPESKPKKSGNKLQSKEAFDINSLSSNIVMNDDFDV